MLTIESIIEKRVRILLRDVDEGGISHKDHELIEWVNEGCAEIARIRPEASSQTLNVSLVEGATQVIPDGATLLLEVVGNVDTATGALTRVVRRVSRDTLDKENVNWPSDTKEDTVKRFVISSTDPRTYYVYPPHTGSAASGLKIVVGTAPALVTAMTDALPLPDIYGAPLANYILFRAFGKQLESPDAQQMAVQMLNIFNDQMGQTDMNQENRSAKNRQPVGARGSS